MAGACTLYILVCGHQHQPLNTYAEVWDTHTLNGSIRKSLFLRTKCLPHRIKSSKPAEPLDRVEVIAGAQSKGED
jgi:hypothetical protein